MNRPRSSPHPLFLLLAFLALGAAFLGAMVSPNAAAAPATHTPVAVLPAAHAAAALAPRATSPTGDLALGISTNPTVICANNIPNCPAGAATARTTLTAAPATNGALAWPAVQVAFVIETTPYAGVGDPTQFHDEGTDPCAMTPTTFSPLCEESNGIPFFVANAQTIANAVQSANPHSQVSFALVDFFATYDDGWNDPDGSEYHVDIQQFVPAAYFGSDVRATFQASVLQGGWIYGDNDLADNVLSSSSITALYGTVIGSALTWSNDTHHVIVLMGAAAPQDPAYPENYGISMSEYGVFGSCSGPSCYGATCEPAYVFANGIQPQCEGWVTSQDGNASHSIAALTRTAPQCTQSVGRVCTVDVIDYNNCVTDPYCKAWPTGRGQNSGPGSLGVFTDIDHILLAGCDLAAATGGTWNGPSWFTCPSGQSGSLQYVSHGPANQPNTANPYLLQALRGIGFGPVTVTQVAKGTGSPVFTFVPFGAIALAPAGELNATASCTRAGAPFLTCQKAPTILKRSALTYLAWNWSTNASTNQMFVGDSWTVSFNIIATGPPYSVVPVDACTTDNCKAGGSGAVSGIFTWANYLTNNNATVALQSFPLSEVTVQIALTPITVPPPPPPPVAPPPPPGIPVPTPVGVPQQVPVGQSISVSNVSLQGIGAGVIAAGATRIGLKNKPLRIGVMSGALKAKTDALAVHKSTSFGRWQ